MWWASGRQKDITPGSRMKIAPLPQDESARLDALRRYEILDTEPEQAFDDLVELAAKICQTPIALVSLVDPLRQWFKAKTGVAACETSRDIAFCAHAILQRAVFEIPDTVTDPRFATNPLVTAEPFIRFYAGTPLVTPDGYALGTLCVIDRVPKHLNEDQRQALTTLGRQVVSLLELRLRHRLLERSVASQKESQLIQSQLSFALDHGIDGAALLDREGRYTYMNQAHAEIYGYEAAELIGQSWTVLYSSEWVARITEKFFPILLQQGHWRGEVPSKKKSGDEVLVEFSLTLLSQQDMSGNWLLCTCRDITAKKMAKYELFRVQARLQSVLDAATEVSIIATDPQGLITVFNRGAERMLGYSTEEMVGKQTPAIIHLPEEVSMHSQALTTRFGRQIEGFGAFVELARLGSSEEREWTYVRKDGSRLTVNLVVTSVRNDGNEVTGYLGVATDITARKQAETKLEQGAREMERRNLELAEAHNRALEATQAKSEFLASMSHEIRTPMNAIIGMADLLQDTALTGEQQEYVRRFSRAATSLTDLINDILDLTKIEAGHLELELVPFNLPDLVDKTAELMAVRANAKALELAAFVHPDVPPYVMGDPTRLRQVLVNLIGNAIKFTEQGEVIIRVDPSRDKANPSALHFFVSDTGIGIPSDKIQTIFDSFTQVDSSTTRKYGGTGLGLNISKRIVELMGSHIEVTSREGHGSMFAFTLQMAAVPGIENTPEHLPISLQGRRILIVDDNDTNRMIVREFLVHLGVILHEASDGPAALTALDKAQRQGEPYDLVILDFHMRGMNGLDLAQAIRALPAFSTLPLVLHASDMRNHSSQRAREAGIASCIHKPISRTRLLASLTEALSPATKALSDPTPPALSTTTDLRPLHILLAEDLEDNRDVVALYVKGTPYVLDMAENGAIAVEKFRANIYDLVFMDIQMPVMDGYQATEAIREWEREQQRVPTPIVAFTANAFKEDLEMSLAVGCIAHLTKPLRKQALLEAIAEHARRPSEQAA